MSRPRTLYEKIWDAHVVVEGEAESVLYVDLHLLNEVMSPQAFAGLRLRKRPVRRPELTLAIADHNTPTEGQALGIDGIVDLDSRAQLATLARNVVEAGIEYLPMGDAKNGIVHVVAPEQGRTRPGMVIVCGDSHTSTHGALGAYAFGIGTSEVEHVLATQTVRQRRSKNLRVELRGTAPRGAYAKDYALAVVAALGASGGSGYVIEYVGDAVRALSIEGRMTLCNMSIEAGARAGLVAPDDKTLAYLAERGVTASSTLSTDPDAQFDRELAIDVSSLAPKITWGTSPAESIDVDANIPDSPDEHGRGALRYMGLVAGAPLVGTPIDRVFLGSCTNGRIEDYRAAADVVRGRRVASSVRALAVPGSRAVMQAAEAEGLDRVFREAGFEWREPGCSMCLGMNPDQLAPGERCASTSNRNFEGRQGRGGRTHLMSPAMAAAAAVAGAIVDVRGMLR